MKLLIYLAVWKRPEITEICFMGINRLRKSENFSIDAFAVISEEEMIPLCEKYNIKWCMYKNFPLGEKKNYGLREAMKLDFDYLVEIGSDDILKDDYLNAFPWDKNIMMLRNFLVLDSETLACKKLTGLKGGTGRAIKKEVLLKCGYLWTNGKERGLDGNSMFKLAECGFMWSIYEGVYSIDIKSEVNIWKYKQSRGVSYPLEEALKGISEQEIEAIKAMAHVGVEN